MSSEFIFGKNPVKECLKAKRREIHSLHFSGNLESFEQSELGLLAKKLNIPTRKVEARELDRITGQVVHQGVALSVGPFPVYHLQDLVADLRDSELILILDSISDPQNFGTLCRSALAFGVRYVILPRDRSVSITPSVIKASAGAIEHLSIVFVTNIAQTLTELKTHNVWCYGASLGETSQDLVHVDPATKSAVVLGSEGFGLRELVAKTCDFLIKIPMKADFDSLNVAQAGTVILYDFSMKMKK